MKKLLILPLILFQIAQGASAAAASLTQGDNNISKRQLDDWKHDIHDHLVRAIKNANHWPWDGNPLRALKSCRDVLLRARQEFHPIEQRGWQDPEYGAAHKKYYDLERRMTEALVEKMKVGEKNYDFDAEETQRQEMETLKTEWNGKSIWDYLRANEPTIDLITSDGETNFENYWSLYQIPPDDFMTQEKNGNNVTITLKSPYDIQFSDTGDFLQKAAANIRSYFEENCPEKNLTINLDCA